MFVKEEKVIPQKIKEISVCTDCGWKSVDYKTIADHKRDHEEYEELKSIYDKFEIGCHVKGVWRQYVYHTEPDNMIPFNGIVCGKEWKKNDAPRYEDEPGTLGKCLGEWGEFYIYNQPFFLLEKKDGTRKWIDFEDIVKYEILGKKLECVK